MDINFRNMITPDGFEIDIDDIPSLAKGNQLIANIFEVTFITNLNNSLMSYGYAGNGVDLISRSYDPNDVQSIAAAVKVSSDNTVAVMRADQEIGDIPLNEKIASASVGSVTKDGDQIYVSINIVPEELDGGPFAPPLTLTIPL